MPTSGLDRHDNDDRPDYCCAARQKISIGEYHLECARRRATGDRSIIERLLPELSARNNQEQHGPPDRTG